MGNERGNNGDGSFSWAGNDPPDLIAGRYEVERLVGTGGTARVYRAVDRLLRRAVAVKVYEHRVVAVEQLRRARERTVQASIDHPGVVALFDSGADGGRPYLVMQLVEGEDLAERLLAGPLGADEVVELATQLAEALAHVHAQRVVHRDLKPANILLGPDGPLISDFGIAHELDSTHITGTGLVTGTAAYLAPEQILGERAEPSTDVYALGLILIECLTGEREYPGTLAESAMARLHRSPRIPAGLPDPLAHTLSRMTAREPADRPGAEQIPQLLRESVVVGTRGRRRWALTAAGGFAAAAAAVVLAAVVARPDVPASSPARLPAAAPPVTSTSQSAGPTALPASAVVAAASRTAVKPSLVAALPPRAAVGGRAGGVGAGSVKGTGKANGQHKGKGKGPGRP